MKRGARGRGPGHYNNAGRNSDTPGPLMTEHIRNLDMELELLKRKREMIEQQQQLLNRQMDYSNQRQYNPPMYGSSNPSSNLNFSFMYDDHSTPDYIPLNSGSRKRPIESAWRDNSQPKRFSGHVPKRGNSKKSTGSRPGPSANPTSTSNASARYYEAQPGAAKKKPPGQKSRITPTQSFKSKPSAPPNKLSTYPVAERKSLVAKAVKATNEAMVLRPDTTPSPQLNGRLELALGHVLKEIRTKYSCIQPYSLTFTSLPIMKIMKNLIRKRVRDVMMGKEVGSLSDVLTIYREKYPLESDVDVVNEGLAHQDLSDVKNILKTPPEGDPKDRFKENISLMVELKLHQMFLKLSKIYSKDAPPGDTTVELTPIPKSEHTDFSKDVTVNSESTQSNDKEENVSKENGDESQEQESISKQKEDTVPIDEEVISDEKDKGGENEKDVTKDKDVISEAEEISATEDQKNISKDTNSKEEENVSKDKEQSKEKEGEVGMEVDENLTVNEETKESVVLDRLIEQKLPEILKKHIKFIKSLINLDEMYDAMVKKKPQLVADIKRTETPPKYFAKVYCRKGFPNKFAMQDFLDPFEPKCIKKLKSMHNLLFVGFDDKEALEKLLAANGTAIGKYTLQITLSENKKGKKPQEKSADENKNEADENENEGVNDDNENNDLATTSDDKIISADIDNQITDLLTSIKQGENSPNVTFVDEDEEDDVMKVSEDNAKNSDPSSENIDSKNDKAEDFNASEVMQQNGNNENDDAIENKIKAEPKTPIKKLDSIDESEENVDAGGNDQKNKVESIKDEPSIKDTPAKASTRAATATPSTIRTRRVSRLAQNNQ